MKGVGLFCCVVQLDHNILIFSVCKRIEAEPTRRGISCVPTQSKYYIHYEHQYPGCSRSWQQRWLDLAAEECVSSRPVGQQKTALPEFKGQCEGCKGRVIHCGQAKHADQFSHTAKEVINYVGSNITDGEWVARSLRTEKLVVIT